MSVALGGVAASTLTRKCNSCLLDKPTAEFRGNRAKCRKCEAEACRKYKAEHREQIREYAHRAKVEWYAEHKEEAKKSAREWAQKNPERVLARYKLRLARLRSRTHIPIPDTKRCPCCDTTKPSAEFNRCRSVTDGLSVKCRECQHAYLKRQRESGRAWDQRHPVEVASKAHQRRVVAALAGPGITTRQWKAILKKYGNKCLMCGATDKKLTMDHVLPLKSGGTHHVSNIQPLCMDCNRKKWTQYIDFRPDGAGQQICLLTT
jgi:5-methylcytosine-specific restriction endonuclease McrA